MKKLLTILYIVCLNILMVQAQPSAVKKASKSILKLTTYKADGSILAIGYGVFIDENGTALTAWHPFEGAASAEVSDYKGQTYKIDCLYGASTIYNVAKLKVNNDKQHTIIPAAIEQGQENPGDEVWCIGYGANSPSFHKLTVNSKETFMTSLPYYIIEQPHNVIGEDMAGAPFVNKQGLLMGLTTTSNTRTDIYIPSANYAKGLEPTALSANDNALRTTSIRIALPQDYNQALLAMIIAEQRYTPADYERTINEFISLFPDKEDGYIYMAQQNSRNGKFAETENAIARALELSSNKDNIHFIFSRIIYDKATTMPDSVYPAWSLDKALTEIDEANTVNPQAIYQIMRGKILYSKNMYDEAFNQFDAINKTGNRDPEVYYYAYQCLKNMKAPQAKQLEQLDSAIAITPKQPIYYAEKLLLLLKMKRNDDALTIGQQLVEIAPQYAEGRGLYGLALCIVGKKAEGIEVLNQAKAMGYTQADAFIRKYGK